MAVLIGPFVRLLVEQGLAVGRSFEGIMIVALCGDTALILLLVTLGGLGCVAVSFKHLLAAIGRSVKGFPVVAFISKAALMLSLMALRGLGRVVVEHLATAIILS